MVEDLAELTNAVSGRYTIERELGRGGMATVYLARDLRHGRRVAIKVLRQELSQGVAADRFLSEIAIAAALVHPNLLPVFDSGGSSDCLYYVMPYVEGESLRARLDRDHRLPVDQALRIARDVGEALSYAHARNVIHRDIKPANILLVEGHAVVSDFGIARAIEQAGARRLTLAGVAVGTPLYMSPEQASGESVVDGRSDVYSLACVLYEMLAGTPPLVADTPRGLLARKLTTAPGPIRTVRADVPPRIDRAIARALNTDPAERVASAAEFVGLLAAPVPGGAREWLASRRAVVAGVVAAAIVAAAAVLVLRGPPGRRVAGLGSRLDVVVFPFRATVPGAAQWEEAIPDLLAAALDGVPGMTVVDPWSVWRPLRADPHAHARSPDPTEAAQLTQHVGAGYFILGSIAQLERDVDVTIRIYRDGTAAPVHTFGVTGAPDSVGPLVRQISLETIRRLAVGLTPSTPARLEQGLTRSPEALKAWLLARDARRRGRLDSAETAIDRALSLDSSFVRALIDAVSIRTWAQSSRGQAFSNMRQLAERAARMSDSLPERSRLHAHAMLASINTNGEAAAVALNRMLAIDSTDFDAWTLLGYVQNVYGWQYGQTDRDALASAEHAVRLDSTDATALAQRVYLAVASNDSADIVRQLRRLARADTTSTVIHGMQRAVQALSADDRGFRSLVDTLTTAPIPDWIRVTRMLRMYRPARAEVLIDRTRSTSSPLTQFAISALVQLDGAEGRWHALDSLRRGGAFTASAGIDRAVDRTIVAGVIAGAGNDELARRSVATLEASLSPDSALAFFQTHAVWLDGWLIGAYHAMFGDTSVARAWRLALGTLPTKGASPVQYTLALRADISSRLAARRGDRQEALTYARQAFEAWDIHTENISEITPEPAIRFHLASLLRASGATDSAAALFRSLTPPTTWMGFYTPRAALEFAELREEARDRATAERYFLTADRLWEHGDSAVAALRERAHRGVIRVGEGGRGR